MSKKKKGNEGYLPAARERAVYITVYDLQGGPIDPRLQPHLEYAVEGVVQKYQNLAMDVKVV